RQPGFLPGHGRFAPGVVSRAAYPNRNEDRMSFETISLLLNWMELGALLAILFRLARTFDLIASTQRELRRAIHHLGERHPGEFSIHDTSGASGLARTAYSPQFGAKAEAL